jgi:hypothetical protein
VMRMNIGALKTLFSWINLGSAQYFALIQLR